MDLLITEVHANKMRSREWGEVLGVSGLARLHHRNEIVAGNVLVPLPPREHDHPHDRAEDRYVEQQPFGAQQEPIHGR